MKNFIFSAFSVALAAAALCPTEAQAGFTGGTFDPAPGEINLEAFPAGVSGVDLKGAFRVNRECQKFATLIMNGKVVKQVPASNIRDVYCVDGDDKGEIGDLHITFWKDAQTSPYYYTGNYKIIIPAGYCYNTAGELNDEMQATYTINNSKFTVDPARGSSMKVLDKMTFTFPGASAVTVNGECTNEYPTGNILYDSDGDPYAETAIRTFIPVVTGANTAEIVFDPPLDQALNFKLEIPTGTFTTTNIEGPATSTNYESSVMYYIQGIYATSDGFIPEPQPGEYTEFKTTEIEGTASTGSTANKQAYFTLTMPESMRSDVQFNMASVKQYKLINRETNESILLKGWVRTSDQLLYLTSSNATEYTTPNSLVPSPGTYDLVIPAQVFKYKSGPYSPEWKIGPYEVKVDENYVAPTYTLEPSNVGTVTFLQDVSVAFPDAQTLWWNPTEYVSVKSGTIEYVGRASVSGNVLNIKIAGKIEVEGLYTFEIPGNAFKVDGRNTPLTFLYDIALPEAPTMEGALFVPVVDDSRIVNMEAYPAGLSNFEIDFENVEKVIYPKGMEIVRDAKGFITLECNNEVLKQVPASNTVDLYTYVDDGVGMEKAPQGNVHVTFFASQQDTPAKYSGRYRVTIPAGFLKNAETGVVYNEEIVAEYVISNQVNCKITPAKGSTVTSLDKLILEFPYEDVADFKLNGVINVEFIDATEDDQSLTLGADNITIDNTTVTVTFPEPYVTKGRLMVDIPYNTFVSYYVDGSAQASANQGFSIWVAPGMSAEGYEIDPVPGTYEKIVSKEVKTDDGKVYYAFFKVTTPEGTTPNMTTGVAKLCKVTNGTYNVNEPFFNKFKGIVLTVDGEKAYYILNGTSTEDWSRQTTLPVENGEFALIFPKNYFFNVGGANEGDIVYKYTFDFEVKDNYTAVPDPSEVLMEPLETITVSFPDAKEATLVAGAKASIKFGSVEYVADAKLDLTDGVKVILTVPAPIIEEGEYVVYLSPANLYVDGEATAINLVYNIDSTVLVNELGVDALDAPVYNLQGIKVSEGKNLKDLTPAVYIINGKKVVVK